MKIIYVNYIEIGILILSEVCLLKEWEGICGFIIFLLNDARKYIMLIFSISQRQKTQKFEHFFPEDFPLPQDPTVGSSKGKRC